MENEQQQDLRESAVFLYGEYADENIPMSEFVDAMLQFASEVSAEKDKRIIALQESEMRLMDANSRQEQRIAELEHELERLKEKLTYN